MVKSKKKATKEQEEFLDDCVEAIKEDKKVVKKELKLKPQHWARQEQIDETLFAPWNDKEVTEDEYKKLKKKVYREKEV